MAIDPAVQFPQPGISAPYQYSPVTTHLNPPIPLQAADYGEIGKTALASAGQVFDVLMKSPVNPEVRAKMHLGTKLAQEGMAHIDWAQKQKGGLGQWQVGIDASGNTYYIPPAQGTKTFQSWIAPNLEDGDGGDGKDKDGKPPAINPETGAGKTPPAPPAPPPIPTAQYTPSPASMFAAAAPPAPSVDNFQGPNQPQTTAAVQQALQRNQFASAGQGVPAGYSPPQPSGPMGAPQGTFLNPATGSYEPLQTQQPPVQPPQPDQAALGSWQAQNAHPVMASGDALNWAKNFDTGAQRATYLPHGGPNGTAAYAFHMKGGGINTVPIEQIVKNGGAASVAGQNTSAALSASDALMNQPPGQAPGMTLGATAQPSQGMQLGQPPPGQPPAAPSQPYQPTDYRTEQGQPPGSYAAQPYEQAVAQAAANPQNLAAQTAPAGQPAQPIAPSRMPNPIAPADAPAAITDLDRTPDGPVDEETGDTRKKKIGNLWYYRDNSDTPWKGRYYTALPGSSTWTQSRAYIGEEGYQEVALPDTVMNQNLEKETGPTGPPELKTLTTQQIKAMRPEQKQAYLDYAKSFHNTANSTSNTETNNFLAASVDAIKQLEQAKDIIHVTPSPADYSDEAKSAYAAYKTNHSLLNDPDPGLKGWVHHVQGRIQSVWSGGDFPASDDMARILGNLATDLRTPGLEPVNGIVTPATPGWHFNAQIPLGRAWMPVNVGKEGTPARENPMDLPAITNLTKGGTSKEAKLAGIQQLEDTVINNLHQRYHLALTDNERVDPGTAKAILDARKETGPDKPLSVPDNVYRDADGKRRNPWLMPQVFGPDDFERVKNKYGSGKHFMGPNEDGNMREYVTP